MPLPTHCNNHNNNTALTTFSCAKNATTTKSASQLKLHHKMSVHHAATTTAPSHSSSSNSCSTTSPRSHLTWLHCTFVTVLLLSSTFVALANCDKLLSVGVVEESRVSPLLGVVAGGAEVARFMRSADIAAQAPHANIAADDYSSRASAPTSVVDKNSRIGGAGAGGGGFLSPYGLRTKFKPQQFYAPSQLQQPNSGGSAEYNDLASLNLVTSGAREDICKEHCVCAKAKNAFITITCDYQANRRLNAVFGTNYRVPSEATSIHIKLAPTTEFRLERGFFGNNTVNSLTIEGVYSEREQVEITTEAFRGNNGPYPEIHLINVFSVVVRSKAFAGNGKITVRNSNDLILYPDAFENAKINGLFVGINDLRIGEKAFNSAQAKLRIESSHIDNIYRFEASLREIRFVNCSIGTINGGTFDVITINSIVFEGCRIDAIKARAITEKLYSKHVSITGAIIGSIESEAIYGSGIAELILTKNKIDTIHENAIHVTAINATITRNNIKHLGNNWLRVKEWSNIVVANNQFGVFGRMLLEETTQPVTCRFDGNSLTQPLPGSLNITNPYCMLREISLNIPCRCNLDWLEALSSKDLRSETYCTIDDKLGHCFNASSFNLLKYRNEVCDDQKTTLDCVANMNLKKIDGHFFTAEELERRDQRIPELIFIVAGSLLLLILAVIAGVVALRFCNRTTKQGGSGQSSNISTTMAHGAGGGHLHEFSHVERQVIDQTLQLMQKKYPEIFKQITERTQLLLQADLPDKKCVKAISQIVNLLNKVTDESGDFVAFNRVLTQHLQPPMPTAPPALYASEAGGGIEGDPIYTEPGLSAFEGFYTSSAIAGNAAGYEGQLSLNTGGGVSDAGHTQLQEHIYAEPNCAQQPLLRNEYASPADRNLDSMDLYTEPVNERAPHLIPSGIAAYAATNVPRTTPQYATPLARNQHQRLPSIPSNLQQQTTSSSSSSSSPLRPQNLPDVLYQSHNPQNNSAQIARPNVKKLAQDLQNMPKFQLNQLTPRQRRDLHLVAPPVYTAPDITHKQHRQLEAARLASPESIDDCEMDMRGAMALPPVADTGSNHSGGSNETVKIDDVIEYADA